MNLHRNTGAPFDREDGTTVARDDVFEPTEKELARFAYKLRPYAGDPAAASRPQPTLPRHQEPSTPGEWGDAWPLQMAPPLYLRLHPNGPHAELAQSLVDAASATLVVEAGEDQDGDQDD